MPNIPGFITVEEATRSNTIVFGAMFLLLIAVCLFSWLYVRREQRRTQKAINGAVAKAVEKAVTKNEQKNEDRRMRMFMAWQDAEEELKRTRAKLATLEKEHAALQTAYDGLQAAAAGCPAAGVRVKKGAFDAHAA